MYRTFNTHTIRQCTELTGRFWDFSPLTGEHTGQTYRIATPCCTENHPLFGNYRGESDYTTTFTAGGNIRLEFKGVSHTATVFLDNNIIATHYNAYTPFAVICKNLTYGTHTLTVRTDNRFSEKSALHIPNDYMSYSGISRPVILESIQDAYIEYVHVTPHYANVNNTTCKVYYSNGWFLNVDISFKELFPLKNDLNENLDANLNSSKPNISNIALSNDISKSKQPYENTSIIVDNYILNLTFNNDDNEAISYNISSISCDYDCDGTYIIHATINFNNDANNNIFSWSPDNPSLYYINATLSQKGTNSSLIIDDYIDRFGFREVTVSGKDILLNGKKLIIKGLNRHEDHPQFGCALPYVAMAADLNLIRDLGANSIRTCHYPNDELFLDMCDELGILIWEENHARGLSEADMRNSNFETQAEQVIKEMIKAHYNHPSIYIWGILNECASETEYGRECYRKQFELIRSLDTSRPCSFASCKFKTDICFDLPDIVSYNIYPLWYHDTDPTEYLNDLYNWVQDSTKGFGKPFLITEVGAGAIYGCHNDYNSKWTEEYQAYALKKQLTAILSHPDISGVYIWQFCDVRVSDEWFAGRPRTMNNKGIVDEYRRRKLAYNIVKDIFTNNN